MDLTFGISELILIQVTGVYVVQVRLVAEGQSRSSSARSEVKVIVRINDIDSDY